MRKTLTFLVPVVMALAFSGCGSSDDPVEPTKASVNANTRTLSPGQTFQVLGQVTPVGAYVECRSGNEAVATVDANGLATAHTTGTAVISFYDAAGYALSTCNLTVSVPVTELPLWLLDEDYEPLLGGTEIPNGSTIEVPTSGAGTYLILWTEPGPRAALNRTLSFTTNDTSRINVIEVENPGVYSGVTYWDGGGHFVVLPNYGEATVTLRTTNAHPQSIAKTIRIRSVPPSARPEATVVDE